MEPKCLVGAADVFSGKVNVSQQQSFGEFVLPAGVQVRARAFVDDRAKHQQLQKKESASNLYDDRVCVVYRGCFRCHVQVREDELFVAQMSGGLGYCHDCRSNM